MDQQFTRTELYQLVWTQPTRTVAASFGISDVALAKTCHRANVPIPPRGYWAKKASSRPISIPPLPPRFPGASDLVGRRRPRSHFARPDWRERMLEEPIPPEPVFDESMESVERRARELVGRVTCPSELRNQHTSVAKLVAQDEHRKVEYAKYKSSYSAPKYESGIGHRWIVTINTLLLTFQRLGCKPSMRTSQYVGAYGEDRRVDVIVGEQAIGLVLDVVAAPVSDGAPAAKGRLRLRVGSGHSKSDEKHWEDGNGVRLEHRLSDIVVQVLVLAERNHRLGAVRHREWMIERKVQLEKELVEIRAEEARKDRELREKQLQERVDCLVSQAAQMERANQIRQYVRSVEQRSEELRISSEKLKHWGTWALSEADRIDPVRNGTVTEAVLQFDKGSFIGAGDGNAGRQDNG